MAIVRRKAGVSVLNALAVQSGLAGAGRGKSGKPAVLLVVFLAILARVARLVSLNKPRRGKFVVCPPVSQFSLTGHLVDFVSNYARQLDYFLALTGKYGKTVRLIMGPVLSPIDTMLVLTEPDHLKHILKDNFENYVKGQNMVDWSGEMFGKGIFAVDGQSWYQQRKIASRIFTTDNMSTEFTGTMLRNYGVLVQALREGSAGGTRPVDIQDMFMGFTMDTFCEIAFGVKNNSLSANPKPEWKAFTEAFDGIQKLLLTRIWRAPWKLQRALALLSLRMPIGPLRLLAGPEYMIVRYQHTMNSTIDRLVETRQREGALKKEGADVSGTTPTSVGASSPRSPSARSPKAGTPRARRNSSATGEDKRLDVVELFMDVKPALSNAEIRDVIKNFLIGGRDTTAVTLTWLHYELARNPEVYAKLRQETKGLNVEDPVEFYNALNKMRYCDAVVKETIRLHTPVPVDAKTAAGDDVLPGGHFVAKGYVMMYCPYLMARDTDLWGPDAASWRPERWLESTVEPSLFVWSSFQAGPRTCLGKDLAILEAKAVVALLSHAGVKLSLWPAEGKPEMVYDLGFVMRMSEAWAQMKVTFDEEQ